MKFPANTAALFALASVGRAASKPNVVVIMADDQDLLLDSMSVMPNVNNLIGAQGITYEKHYCTVAWCCPSRVNFLTGRAAHNTNVTALSPPYGGYPKFVNQGLNKDYLPIWISEAGINTYYTGKFMNSYATYNWNNPQPKGWTNHSMLLDPWTYAYMNSHWTRPDNNDYVGFENIHTTNVTTWNALSMIDQAAAADNQFFLMVTPVAPHQDITAAGVVGDPVDPPELAGQFADRSAPRTENFNPDVPSGASWVYNQNPLSAAQVEAADKIQRHRLANIAGIDIMVAQLIERLEQHGLLDNTYIIYTSDNGFHIGNHRMTPGKRCGYEEDINVPLLIRGPGVPAGVVTDITNSHTDMAPTILQMLGVAPRPDFDGAAIAYTDATLTTVNKYEYVNVEFWDPSIWTSDSEKLKAEGGVYNNTYKSLRMQTAGGNFYYSVWCDGSLEFYDMTTDTQQMNNILFSAETLSSYQTQYFNRPTSQLISRLDTVLLVLKSCKGDSCRSPWGVLFPGGKVTGLQAAMDESYDEFFANQPKVRFTECIPGHMPGYEGPTEPNVFGTSQRRWEKSGFSSAWPSWRF